MKHYLTTFFSYILCLGLFLLFQKFICKNLTKHTILFSTKASVSSSAILKICTISFKLLFWLESWRTWSGKPYMQLQNLFSKDTPFARFFPRSLTLPQKRGMLNYVPYMLTCPTCLVPNTFPCLVWKCFCGSHFPCLEYLRAWRASCHTCLHALRVLRLVSHRASLLP